MGQGSALGTSLSHAVARTPLHRVGCLVLVVCSREEGVPRWDSDTVLRRELFLFGKHTAPLSRSSRVVRSLFSAFSIIAGVCFESASAC